MPSLKKLVILVGPKGSGKTFVGTLAAKELGHRFLRVEPIFLENLRASRLTGEALDEEGYSKVTAAVHAELAGSGCLFIESTGASSAFPAFLEHMRSRYEVLLVSIRAPLDTCLERVRTRDQSTHIPVSDHRVLEINERAAKVQLPWDLEIDNTRPAAPQAILEDLRGLLERPTRSACQSGP